MYPIRHDVAQLYDAEQAQVLRISGTDKNGATISITDADVMSHGFTIDRYSSTGTRVEVGTAVSAELSLKLNNYDGRFNAIVFEGAELFVEIGIADWQNAPNDIYWMPCGYFTCDKQPRTRTIITLSALDRMMLFDTTAFSASSLPFPTTVAGLVTQVAALCGVPFVQDITSMPNAAFSIAELPDAVQEITYRKLIQWCAGLMASNAYIDWNGNLYFSWYESQGGGEILGDELLMDIDAPTIVAVDGPGNRSYMTSSDVTTLLFNWRTMTNHPTGYTYGVNIGILALDSGATGGYAWCRWYATNASEQITVVPGHIYEFSCYARRNDHSATSAAVWVSFGIGVDWNNNYKISRNDSVRVVAGTTDWVRISFRVTMPRNSAVYFTYSDTEATTSALFGITMRAAGVGGGLDLCGFSMKEVFEAEGTYISSPDKRYSSDMYENDVSITGVTYTDIAGDTHLAGTDAYAVDLSDNMLVESDITTALSAVYTKLATFTYRPYEAKVVNAPWLWPMDRISFVDAEGNGHPSIVTNVNLTINSHMAMAGRGESITTIAYRQPNSFTPDQQEQIERLRNISTEAIDTAIDNATQQITGATDSHVRFIYDSNGGLQEIVIMDTDSVSTATKVWRWNSGGLGYSSNGYAGPYTTAITQNGSIVADFITTGQLTANIIRAGILQSLQDPNSYWNLATGEMNLQGTFRSLTYDETIDEGVCVSVADGVLKLQAVDTTASEPVEYVTIDRMIQNVDYNPYAELSEGGARYYYGARIHTSNDTLDTTTEWTDLLLYCGDDQRTPGSNNAPLIRITRDKIQIYGDVEFINNGSGGWTELTGISSITTPATNGYGGGGLMWRKEGSHVFIKGGFDIAFSSRTQVCLLPSSITPTYTTWRYQPAGNYHYARIEIGSDGVAYITTVRDMGSGSVYSQSTWVDMQLDYWI